MIPSCIYSCLLSWRGFLVLDTEFFPLTKYELAYGCWTCYLIYMFVRNLLIVYWAESCFNQFSFVECFSFKNNMHIGTYYLYRLEQARTRISVICKYMWLESKWVLICYCSLSLAKFYVNSYNETQLRACLIYFFG